MEYVLVILAVIVIGLYSAIVNPQTENKDYQKLLKRRYGNEKL